MWSLCDKGQIEHTQHKQLLFKMKSQVITAMIMAQQ